MKRICVLVLMLMLVRCATVDDAKPPTIRLENLQLGTAGLFSQELLLDVRIGNPNDFSLPLNGLTFELEVNGQRLAEGLSNDSITIPRLGYATIAVTGTAGTLDIIRQLMTLGQRDAIEYRLHGIAYVGHVGQNMEVPYERTGRLSLLPEPPREAPGGVRTLVPIVR